MKKKIFAILSLALAISLTACSSNDSGGKDVSNDKQTKENSSNTLVVYSPNSEGIVSSIIPAFEESTGINVELQQAGTGELFTKLKGEKAQPVADVIWGSAYSLFYENKDLFDEYVSTNDSELIKEYQHNEFIPAADKLDGSCIIINKDLVKDIKIEGYEDLLNPELKGKIATADPTSSSSAFCHLTNMLKVMGGYEDEKAWQYVKDLFTNVDGKIQSSSSSVYKTVADGEMAVGLSYEDPVMQLKKDGADNIDIVYMKEGSIFLPSVTAIVKNAPNQENAKKFIDFITSKEAQQILASQTTNRPVRDDVEMNDYMKDLKDIKLDQEDYEYVTSHQKEIVEKYKEIFADIQG
ncbi:extracellular solute-binding protein [Anaerococcus sp. WCA-380-WT-2B]|uniref:Extracellular solute-binding protein n=1 Tax=Anaerococcus porci TaxID=2652269 RepID=A0A6N7VTU3_9FIRM|nr:extracellular solute-binding protein [Anaerococcus porci]MSS77493.1 extracellular solute-binding protein [Anaerococcus porci]